MNTPAMGRILGPAARVDDSVEVFCGTPSWTGYHGVQAPPSGGDPWRTPDVPMPSGCSQVIRGHHQLPGPFTVFILTAAGFPNMYVIPETRRVPCGGNHGAYKVRVYSVGDFPREELEEPCDAPRMATSAKTAADHVDAIQETLGLSVTQVAAIAQVERATVHNWLRTNAAAPSKPRSRERLLALYQLACRWAEMELPEPRRLLGAALDDTGTSLLELLRKERWDDDAIQRGIEQVAQRMREEIDHQARKHTVAELEAVGTTVPTNPAAAVGAERARVRLAMQRARRFGRQS